MIRSRLSSLVLAASILPASLALGAEKEAEREKHVVQNEGEDSSLTQRNRKRERHENSDKLKIDSISHSPDPFSVPVDGSLGITAKFDARPTDAGAGNVKNGKTFAIRVAVTLSPDGKVIGTEPKEFPVKFPTDLPASKYFSVTCPLTWDGKDENGAVVPDGTYTYTVQGTLVRYDQLGNGKPQEHVVATSASLSGTVVIDSTPPLLSDFSPADGTYTNEPRIPVSARATDAGSGIASVTLTVEGTPIGSYDPTTGIVSWTPIADLPEKWIKAEVVATDSAGNAASVSWKLCEDRTPPELAPLTPADGSFTNDPRAAVTGGVADSLSGVAAGTVSIELNGDPVATVYDPGTHVAVHDPQADLPEMWIGVTLAAEDLAGNAACASWQFCEDRTAPVGTPVSPAPDTWTGEGMPEVVAAFADKLAGLDPTSGEMTVGGQDADPVFDEATERLVGSPPADLPEGNVDVIATMKDLAGNQGSRTWMFKVDLTPPVASDPSPANGFWTNDTMPEISASLADPLSGVDPASIILEVDDSPIEEPGFVDGRVTHTPGAALAEGDVEISVTASDAVGNAMPAPFEWSFGVDTTPATVTMTSPSAHTNEVRPLFTVDVTDALSGVDDDTLVVKLD
ncbi:MAG: hypothetical protein ACYTKD_28910, partial [Planctomycetota bacterium]